MCSGQEGPSETLPRSQPCLVLSLQVSVKNSTPGVTFSLLIIWSLKWFFFLPMCVSSFYAFLFSCLRYEAELLLQKVPCRRYFWIPQHLTEHTQGCLGSKSHWFFLLFIKYIILKFPGDHDESKMQTPPALCGCPFRSTGKKNKNASPNRNSTFSTLTRLEKDLVKFVSTVQKQKLVLATGGNASNGTTKIIPASMLTFFLQCFSSDLLRYSVSLRWQML